MTTQSTTAPLGTELTLRGIVLGIVISLLASQAIGRQFDLPFEFSAGWILTAIAIAVGGSLIGALYPAWRAAGIDPVEVMVNE